MKKILNLSIILILSILYSCAGNYSVLKKNTIHELKKPQPETARVVFLRPQSGLSAAGFAAVYDKDKLIGMLPKSSYFAYDTKPGKHIFGAVFGRSLDFVEADITGGKTYYVIYSTYDTFIAGVHGKMLAIKKNSEQMKKVKDWLSSYRLKQSELTEEGIQQYEVHAGENGKYINAKPGGLEFTVDIEKVRKDWLIDAKKSGKDKLLSSDGV